MADEIEYVDLDEICERQECDLEIGYGDGPVCKFCGEEMEWSDCWNCGGEGSFDGYEEDPLWYDQGDEIPCSFCNSKGGYYICTNPECHEEEMRHED